MVTIPLNAHRETVEVIFNDVHVPEHDRKAFNLLLAVIRKVEPDIVTCLGDMLDCYTISRFEKDPARKFRLSHEIAQARTMLEEVVQASPTSKFIFHGGNHEDRLRKYVWRRCPDLECLPELSWPVLLHLDPTGWTYLPYETPFKIGPLWHHHGDVIRQKSGYTARALMEKVGGNAICGHTHRLSHIHRTTWSDHHQAWENGCLCKLKANYMTGTPDWQQGFCIVTYAQGGQRFKVEQLHIHKGKCWLQGEVFCG